MARDTRRRRASACLALVQQEDAVSELIACIAGCAGIFVLVYFCMVVVYTLLEVVTRRPRE